MVGGSAGGEGAKGVAGGGEGLLVEGEGGRGEGRVAGVETFSLTMGGAWLVGSSFMQICGGMGGHGWWEAVLSRFGGTWGGLGWWEHVLSRFGGTWGEMSGGKEV